jgi:hypothetical protein
MRAGNESSLSVSKCLTGQADLLLHVYSEGRVAMQNRKSTRVFVRAVRHVGGLTLVAAAVLWTAPGWGKDFCCPCGNGEMISVNERNSMMATMKCSLLCNDATPAVSGQCKVAAAEPAAAQKAGASGEVELFTTDDCSGNAASVAASSNDLSLLAADGLYSFQVLSGGPASVWSGTSFSGTRTEPVAPSLCVSPGWRIKSLKIGTY